MITRDVLLYNGFKFRLYDGSSPESNCGEYTWQKGIHIIRISWGGDFYGWTVNINNHDQHLGFNVLNHNSVEIDFINKAIELCRINFKIVTL